MDYFSILDLNKEPFSNSPDPDFFFSSRQHQECLQKLELSLHLRRGLNVVIGEVGTGKTTLCRQLIRKFSQKSEIDTHLILDPHFKDDVEFLNTVARMLTGKKPAESNHGWQIKEYIKQVLFHKGVDQKKTTVLIIDEGQKISPFCLEILREFLNYETNDFKLLQIVIFAQKEFQSIVRKYPNFADRINLYHVLKPLKFLDTRLMIKYRLERSSNSAQQLNLFTFPALIALYRATGGYPRKIINLCHQCVLAMIIQNRSKVSYLLVRSSIQRVFSKEPRSLWKGITAASAVIGALALLLVALAPEQMKPWIPAEVYNLRALLFKTESPSPVAAKIEEPSPSAHLATTDVKIPNLLAPAVVEPSSPTTPQTDPQPSDWLVSIPIDSVPEPAEPPAAIKPQADEQLAATYPDILGKITVKRDETLSRIILQVYGGFNNSYFESIIKANPGISNPDRIEIGQTITLPAIPARVTPVAEQKWWIKIDEKDTLTKAFNVLRTFPEDAPPIRIIPTWSPAGGNRFMIVLKHAFVDRDTADIQMGMLPAEISKGSQLLTWENEDIVYFANPYTGNSANVYQTNLQ